MNRHTIKCTMDYEYMVSHGPSIFVSRRGKFDINVSKRSKEPTGRGYKSGDIGWNSSPYNKCIWKDKTSIVYYQTIAVLDSITGEFIRSYAPIPEELRTLISKIEIF